MGTMQMGAYTVEHQLGAGGMSLVWLARDPRGQLVVLKRQLNPADDDRLRDEGRIGLRLRHVGIVQTFDLFEHEGRPVLVLEFVPGASLVALRKAGALPPAAVCCIGADIAAGLAALHGATDEDGRDLRILHRDVSPANIIVSPDGRGRLIDLGIARSDDSNVERTRTGDLRGTVRYLAPELFEGRLHSVQSDLWALGVCLFEAALGRPAALGPEATILAAVVRGTLLQLRPGESIAAPLAEAIGKLCAPQSGRIETALAAATLLKQAERACGEGRAAAASAVYAVVDPGATSAPVGTESPAPVQLAPARAAPGVRGPASDIGDDPFVRFAASTYCAVDNDDVMFTPGQMAATAVTPVHARPAVDPTAAGRPLARPPASDPDNAPAPDTELWSPLQPPPRSSPGAMPAGADAWNIPRPSTGGGIDAQDPSITVPLPPAADESFATALASVDPVDDGDDILQELRSHARVPMWPLAAIAVVALVALAVLFLGD